MPFGWHGSQVLWWDWPGSGSIAADGVALYEGTRRIATGLMWRDYVAVCGRHLAVTAGGDRYATHGKRIVFDGRNVSLDATRSWVSPSCNTDGTLVAAAGHNWEESRFGREHRAIWRLLPSRRQLTRPPVGWTDEYPHVLRNGDVLFVRTRQVPFGKNGAWWTTTHAQLDVLKAQVADLKKQIEQMQGRMEEMKRVDAEHAEKTFFLRSHYAAWKAFINQYPDLMARWKLYIRNDFLTTPKELPEGVNPEWPPGAEG